MIQSRRKENNMRAERRYRRHDYNCFSISLYKLLRERKMTQTALAEKICVHKGVVNKWINGVRYPRLDDAARVADVLGVSLDELYGRDTA